MSSAAPTAASVVPPTLASTPSTRPRAFAFAFPTNAHSLSIVFRVFDFFLSFYASLFAESDNTHKMVKPSSHSGGWLVPRIDVILLKDLRKDMKSILLKNTYHPKISEL